MAICGAEMTSGVLVPHSPVAGPLLRAAHSLGIGARQLRPGLFIPVKLCRDTKGLDITIPREETEHDES